MARFRGRVVAILAMAASILAVSSVGAVSASAVEDLAAENPAAGNLAVENVAVPSRDFSVENAAEILPSGFEREGNDFIYAEGEVVITPALFAAQAQGCVAHYLCLYRNANYQGDRWMFKDEYWQNLRNWGASDVVSSWKNRQGSCDNAKLGWNSIEQGITPTLTLACTGEQANMGNWNDKASSVHG